PSSLEGATKATSDPKFEYEARLPSSVEAPTAIAFGSLAGNPTELFSLPVAQNTATPLPSRSWPTSSSASCRSVLKPPDHEHEMISACCAAYRIALATHSSAAKSSA